MTPAELNDWMLGLSREIRGALEAHAEANIQAAEADRVYKREWAKAFLRADGTVKDRECKADLDCDELRYQRRLAEDSQRTADLAIRARMAQLSAFQSIASGIREEAKFGRTGPVPA